jgi:hypothetical protein
MKDPLHKEHVKPIPLTPRDSCIDRLQNACLILLADNGIKLCQRNTMHAEDQQIIAWYYSLSRDIQSAEKITAMDTGDYHVHKNGKRRFTYRQSSCHARAELSRQRQTFKTID